MKNIFLYLFVFLFININIATAGNVGCAGNKQTYPNIETCLSQCKGQFTCNYGTVLATGSINNNLSGFDKLVYSKNIVGTSSDVATEFVLKFQKVPSGNNIYEQDNPDVPVGNTVGTISWGSLQEKIIAVPTTGYVFKNYMPIIGFSAGSDGRSLIVLGQEYVAPYSIKTIGTINFSKGGVVVKNGAIKDSIIPDKYVNVTRVTALGDSSVVRIEGMDSGGSLVEICTLSINEYPELVCPNSATPGVPCDASGFCELPSTCGEMPFPGGMVCAPHDADGNIDLAQIVSCEAAASVDGRDSQGGNDYCPIQPFQSCQPMCSDPSYTYEKIKSGYNLAQKVPKCNTGWTPNIISGNCEKRDVTVPATLLGTTGQTPFDVAFNAVTNFGQTGTTHYLSAESNNNAEVAVYSNYTIGQWTCPDETYILSSDEYGNYCSPVSNPWNQIPATYTVDCFTGVPSFGTPVSNPYCPNIVGYASATVKLRITRPLQVNWWDYPDENGNYYSPSIDKVYTAEAPTPINCVNATLSATATATGGAFYNTFIDPVFFATVSNVQGGATVELRQQEVIVTEKKAKVSGGYEETTNRTCEDSYVATGTVCSSFTVLVTKDVNDNIISQSITCSSSNNCATIRYAASTPIENDFLSVNTNGVDLAQFYASNAGVSLSCGGQCPSVNSTVAYAPPTSRNVGGAQTYSCEAPKILANTDQCCDFNNLSGGAQTFVCPNGILEGSLCRIYEDYPLEWEYSCTNGYTSDGQGHCISGGDYNDKCWDPNWSCPAGYTRIPSTSTCSKPNSPNASVVCPGSGTFISGLSSCMVGRTMVCPNTDASGGVIKCFDLVGSYDWKCSVSNCDDPSRNGSVQDSQVSNDEEKDEAFNEDGSCNPESVRIFEGKSSRCQKAGIHTMGMNCCDLGMIPEDTQRNPYIEKAAEITSYVGYAVTAVQVGIAVYAGAMGTTIYSSMMVAFISELVATGSLTAATTAASLVAEGVAGGALTGAGPMVSAATVLATVGVVLLVAAIVYMVLSMLFHCDDNDFKTIKNLKKGKCHYVGTYCSSKFLGGCIGRSKSFCCFDSMLSRITHEQGRPQINSFNPTAAALDNSTDGEGNLNGNIYCKIGCPPNIGPQGWGGDVKSPNCRGFTIEEFALVDFGAVDLQEWIDVMMLKIKTRMAEDVSLFAGDMEQRLTNGMAGFSSLQQ